MKYYAFGLFCLMLAVLVLVGWDSIKTHHDRDNYKIQNDSLQAVNIHKDSIINTQHEAIIQIIQRTVVDTAAVRNLSTDSLVRSIRFGLF